MIPILRSTPVFLAARAFTCALACLGLGSAALAAQQGTPQAQVPPQSRVVTIPLDPASAAIQGVLPFDEPFFVTGSAAISLLSLDLWWADSTQFSLAQCLANQTGTLPHSSWTRGGSQSTFLLPVGALAPNRMYRFCVRSVDALSASDSAAFVARAGTAVRKLLTEKTWIPSGTIESAPLRELRARLRGALPKGAIVIPAASVLADPTACNDQCQARLDTLAFATFIGFDQLESTRGMAAAAVRDQASTVEVNKLGRLVLDVSREPGLAQLSAIARAIGVTTKPEVAGGLPKALSERLADAVAVGLRWQALNGDDPLAAAVAYGTTSLAELKPPSNGNANPEEVRSEATLAKWAANLDTSVARIASLRELLRFAAQDPVVRKALEDQAKFDQAAWDRLTALDDRLRATNWAAVTQRNNVRLLSEAVAAVDDAIQGVVAGIAGRDVKQTGYVSTTAASYEARAKWYVGQDLGIIYGARGKETREASPYLGLTIYLHPVNKRAPKPLVCFWRCTSLSLGVPTSTWEQADRFKGIIAGRPLVLGVGTRIGDYLRVGYGGSMVYSYEYLPSGQSRRRIGVIHGVTVTIDTDLRDVVSGVASAIFPKT